MTFSQAFTQWAVAPRNTVLAAKSRDAVRRVLMKKWGDIELEQFSETFARRIFRESREPLELLVKAASILVYVLQWGGDHDHCRRPKFTYDIASEEYHKAHEQQPAAAKPRRQPMPPTLAELQGKTHLPAAAKRAAVPQQPSPAEPPSTTTPKNKSDMKQTESPAASGEAPETSNLQPETKRPRQKGPRGKAPRPVTQIDPQTLQPLQQFPTIREAAETVGCLASNIHRAVSQLRSAGGYYWCAPENAPQFADLMARKKTTPVARRALAATINKGRRKKVGDAKTEKTKAEKEQQPKEQKTLSDLSREADENLVRIVRQYDPRFKLGDDVWNKSVKELRGRTGVVVGIGDGPEGLTYDVQYGKEVWKLSEPDLEPAEPKPGIERLEPISQRLQPAALAAFTDRDLCDELRRRGWSITLTMAAD